MWFWFKAAVQANSKKIKHKIIIIKFLNILRKWITSINKKLKYSKCPAKFLTIKKYTEKDVKSVLKLEF